MRPWFGFALFLLTVARARAAAAAEPAAVELAALEWKRLESAASCPSPPEVTRAIEQRLGHAALVPKAQATLVIDAKLEGRPSGGFRIEIEMVRGDKVVGRRELESEDASCQSVAETAALVIALTIDPEASLEPLAIPVTPKPAPPTATHPAPQAKSQEPATEHAPRATPDQAQWHADLELGGGVAAGTLPKVTPVLLARGRAMPPKMPFAIELEGSYFPPVQVETQPGKGSDFSAFYVGAGLCTRPTRAHRFGWSLCAGGEVGAIRGEGYGFQTTTTFSTLTAALAARGTLWFRFLEPLALVAGPSVTIPLKRDYFETETADGTESLFRMSAVGGSFSLGVVLEL